MRLENAGFWNISTEYVDSSEKKNTVLYANYSSGAVLKEDTEIVLVVSNGKGESTDEEDAMGDLLDMAGRH